MVVATPDDLKYMTGSLLIGVPALAVYSMYANKKGNVTRRHIYTRHTLPSLLTISILLAGRSI